MCPGSAASSCLAVGPTGKGAPACFLSDLVVAYALPPHTNGFSLQVLDLTHIWSASDSDAIDLDDILASAAAVYVFIKLNLSPQQRYPRTLTELLTAFAELLTRQQPDDVPVFSSCKHHPAHDPHRIPNPGTAGV